MSSDTLIQIKLHSSDSRAAGTPFPLPNLLRGLRPATEHSRNAAREQAAKGGDEGIREILIPAAKSQSGGERALAGEGLGASPHHGCAALSNLPPSLILRHLICETNTGHLQRQTSRAAVRCNKVGKPSGNHRARYVAVVGRGREWYLHVIIVFACKMVIRTKSDSHPQQTCSNGSNLDGLINSKTVQACVF